MMAVWTIAELVSDLLIIKKITGTDNYQPERSSSKGREVTTREGKKLGKSAGNKEWDSLRIWNRLQGTAVFYSFTLTKGSFRGSAKTRVQSKASSNSSKHPGGTTRDEISAHFGPGCFGATLPLASYPSLMVCYVPLTSLYTAPWATAGTVVLELEHPSVAVSFTQRGPRVRILRLNWQKNQ